MQLLSANLPTRVAPEAGTLLTIVSFLGQPYALSSDVHIPQILLWNITLNAF